MRAYRRRQLMILAAGLGFAQLSGAQTGERQRRIGVIIPFPQTDREAQLQLSAFREELARLGWGSASKVTFDYRWADGGLGRIRAAAKEVVALRPDVILARTTPVTAALRTQTREIPIVFVVVSDPVGDGLVESLNRPGGNITGFTNVQSSFGSKWLELLKAMAPAIREVAVMYNPKTAPGGGLYYWRLVADAARAIGMKATPATVADPADIERAIGSLSGAQAGGLIVTPDVTTFSNHRLIISLAAAQRVPAIYAWPSAPEGGGLMSYGVEYIDLYTRAAGYVDRILRGTRPGELPIQQPTKFELIINLTAAEALGLSVSQDLRLRADRLIR